MENILCQQQVKGVLLLPPPPPRVHRELLGGSTEHERTGVPAPDSLAILHLT